MGSKERIARLKSELRKDILCAALAILKNDGRQSLSLRKIADRIEYSPPVIYSYFKNKEAILIALCELCYQQFNGCIEKNCRKLTNPEERLTAIVTTCWNFAIDEKEMYDLMWEVGSTCTNPFIQFKELGLFLNFLSETLKNLCGKKVCTEEYLLHKSQTAIAVMHGHICLNYTLSNADPKLRSRMLNETILYVMNLINDYNLTPHELNNHY